MEFSSWHTFRMWSIIKTLIISMPLFALALYTSKHNSPMELPLDLPSILSNYWRRKKQVFCDAVGVRLMNLNVSQMQFLKITWERSIHAETHQGKLIKFKLHIKKITTCDRSIISNFLSDFYRSNCNWIHSRGKFEV